MKKSLVKLVATSAVAVTLAGASLPAAHAYVDSNNKDWGTLVNLSNEDAQRLLEEISGKIKTLRAEIGKQSSHGDNVATGLIKDLEAEEAVYAAFKDAFEVAKDDLAAKKEADKEAKEAKEAARIALREAADHAEKVQADFNELVADAGEKRDAAIRAAERAHEDATANLPGSEAEHAAAGEANAVYNDAQAALEAAEEAGNRTEEEIEALKTAVQNALAEKNAAEEAYRAAEQNHRDALDKAQADETAAKNAAEREYNESVRAFRVKYDISEVYGERGYLEQAELDKEAAETAKAEADQKALEAAAALEAAQLEYNTQASQLSQAQTDLRNAQAALSAAMKELVSLEKSLMELVSGKAQGDTVGLGNLTEEEKAAIKEIFGFDSKELEEFLQENKENYEKLKEIEDLLNKDGEFKQELPGEGEEDKKSESGSEDKKEDESEEDKKEEEKSEEKSEDKKSASKGEKLPETGEASMVATMVAAATSVLAGFGLIAPRFRKED